MASGWAVAEVTPGLECSVGPAPEGAVAAGAVAKGVQPLARSFYRRDPLQVAPELLNKLLVAGDRVGRIVEVEAYGGPDDSASHSWRGRTRRNATMFGPAGLAYVYFTYGMHWCANATCGEEGEGLAVLLRAASPVTGIEAMRVVRPAARRDRDLCSGPAKLCQAMGLGRDHDGADLVSSDRDLAIVTDGMAPPERPGVGVCIGIGTGPAALYPWRWWVTGDPNVSRPG